QADRQATLAEPAGNRYGRQTEHIERLTIGSDLRVDGRGIVRALDEIVEQRRQDALGGHDDQIEVSEGVIHRAPDGVDLPLRTDVLRGLWGSGSGGLETAP